MLEREGLYKTNSTIYISNWSNC